MATAGIRRGSRDIVNIWEDEPRKRARIETEEEAVQNAENMSESRDPLEDSGCTRSADSEDADSDIEDLVLEDMQRLENSFKGFSKKYRLVNRIGEGTFSTVYKAEDLQYDFHQNDWDIEEKENASSKLKHKPTSRRRRPHYVAIKKIYVTSSPARIMNELELLHDLRHCEAICPLITAFRDKDQVVAILPYFRHADFRSYFRDLQVPDMRVYFRELFLALSAVHSHGIIHRDIKPTNFLYDTVRKRGVLVDFGLAERQDAEYQPCLCEQPADERRHRQLESYYASHDTVLGYPRQDTRPSQRANRAGTRGFRAPEVLFKCTAQTSKIDVWAAGIILLTMLARRFPFFNSADDIDAVIELSTMFGRDKMRRCGLLHGMVLETNIPTVGEHGHTLEKIIIWSTRMRTRDAHGRKYVLADEELEAVAFLYRCLDLDANARISADEALAHPFLAVRDQGSEDEMDVLCLSSPS